MTRYPNNIGPRMMSVLRSLGRYQRWVTPSDIGGSDRSHHSGTLALLVGKGLVRFKQCGMPEPPPGENGQRRGNLCYRLTAAGEDMLT